jgi:hypothetical protein
MEIRDLFSHKIHSSSESWANKLIDLAFVFSEFDRQPFDRQELEERLSRISPRASTVARDPSKFRDEISAYPAYLGLYRVELINSKWHFILSETAKKFLVTEEPNVPAFMLLQLILFQYPNGMGVAYYSDSDKVRIQANTRDRTLEFIQNGIHLSPFRLICKGIQAKSNLNQESIFNISLTYDEIFALANDPRINIHANPSLELVKQSLVDFSNNLISPPKPYESRFHILKHTDFLIPEKSGVRIRNPINSLDFHELSERLIAINSINLSFNGFDDAEDSNDLLKPIVDGTWGRYFDGIVSLSSDVVNTLTKEEGILQGSSIELITDQTTPTEKPTVPISVPLTYAFRKRNQDEDSYSTYSTPQTRTDPELTRIKRQKSNLSHKLILQQLEEYLESKGCDPLENDHIDLFAQIPGDGKFLFEVKSMSNINLLSQTRKGVSQLYEYRFRYQEEIGYDVSLCLVFPKKPDEIDWIEDYVCKDRGIGIIWFEGDSLKFSEQGRNLVENLI